MEKMQEGIIAVLGQGGRYGFVNVVGENGLVDTVFIPGSLSLDGKLPEVGTPVGVRWGETKKGFMATLLKVIGS